MKELFGVYTDASCPVGTNRLLAAQTLGGFCSPTAEAPRGSVPTCPGGSTPYKIETQAREKEAICVPNDVDTYDIVLTNPFPCRTGDYLGISDTMERAPSDAPDMSKFKCIPSDGRKKGAGAVTGGNIAGIDDLRTQYTRKAAEYDAAVQQALANDDAAKATQIQKLNGELSALLEQMIQKLTSAKTETSVLKTERDELVKKLQRIQYDYNGLVVNTDSLETLRRIRQQESGVSDRVLKRYLIFFFVLCVGILLVLLFLNRKGSQSESSVTSAATPSIMPPFT